jgi:hypothetical protein
MTLPPCSGFVKAELSRQGGGFKKPFPEFLNHLGGAHRFDWPDGSSQLPRLTRQRFSSTQAPVSVGQRLLRYPGLTGVPQDSSSARRSERTHSFTEWMHCL